MNFLAQAEFLTYEFIMINTSTQTNQWWLPSF
jgi:hypothetical protein